MAPKRQRPNILVTGTPGTGKSSLCLSLLSSLLDGYQYHNISEIAINNNFIETDDAVRNTKVIDEDKVNDFLEDAGVGSFGPKDGGHLVDYHSSDFFPERFFDLVVSLSTPLEVLNQRLLNRGYPEAKVEENLSCETFQVSLIEAIESYPDIPVVELESATIDDFANIEETLGQMIKEFEQK